MTNQPLPFEIRGHTADLRLYASGKTKEELFSNMILGMSGILKSTFVEESEEELLSRREVTIDSADLAALLVDFLNEVLYLSNTNKEVYRKVDFVAFSDTHLEAELSGKEVEGFDEDIKAATYHEVEVKQGKDGFWEATVILDI